VDEVYKNYLKCIRVISELHGHLEGSILSDDVGYDKAYIIVKSEMEQIIKRADLQIFKDWWTEK
jgi:hypothetical protein